MKQQHRLYKSLALTSCSTLYRVVLNETIMATKISKKLAAACSTLYRVVLNETTFGSMLNHRVDACSTLYRVVLNETSSSMATVESFNSPCSTLYRVVLNETTNILAVPAFMTILQYPLSGRTK